VEAAERSGTAATAHAALHLNRVVFAVPGPVTSPVSRGCHRLIALDGALLAGSADEVLAVVDLRTGAAASNGSHARDRLGAREKRVLDALPSRRRLTAVDVVRETGLAPGEVLAALEHLGAVGFADESEAGWRVAL
jgi:DNA processing protein